MAVATTPMRSAARALLRHAPFKPVVFDALRRCAHLPERAYRHLAFHGPIQIPLPRECGFRMHHFGHQVENDLFWAGFGGNWEATSLRLWLRLVRRADLVLDVGANTGVYALSAKAVAPRAEVIAYEPVSRVHHRLVQNIALNGMEIATRRAAVSDHDLGAVLYDVPTDHVYSAGLNPAVLGPRDDVIERAVPTLRLEDELAQATPGRIVIKIDTEGHERQVIAGLGTAFARMRPLLLVEILDQASGQAIADRLAPWGYRFFELREREGVVPTQSLGRGGRNYLLCPEAETRALGLEQGVAHTALDPELTLAEARS